MSIWLKAGAVLLILGVILMKGGLVAGFLPDVITENMTWVLAGGIMLTLFGLAGFIGLIGGIVLSLIVLLGGFV